MIYLVFNEGYTAAEDPAGRDDLAAEALRLAALVARLLPEDDEARGLEALLLLQHARRAARTDPAGELVSMEDQDRSRWDQTMVAAGLASLRAARASVRRPGFYRLQAEIAAVHATAPDAAATDWAAIVTGYDALLSAAAVPGDHAQSRRRAGVSRRSGRRADAPWRRSSRLVNWRATTCCPRFGPICCAGPGAATRRSRPTERRSRRPRRPRSDGSWSAGWPRCLPPVAPAQQPVDHDAQFGGRGSRVEVVIPGGQIAGVE